MISYLTPEMVGPSESTLRLRALQSAIAFRDGSFGARSTELARRACRALMREAAFQWRFTLGRGR